MVPGLLMFVLAAAAPDTATGAVAETAAMAAARANRAAMKAPPVFKSGPEAEFPEGAREAGEFGKAIVSGIVGADGRMTEASIALSTRSARLDAAALAAAQASLFDPARDAAGTAIAVPVRMPFEFSNAKGPGKGGGVLRYRCDQVVRDYDWWYATWPADAHDDFYLMTLGFSMIAKSRTAKGELDPSAMGKVNRDFDERWRAAVETCRKTPERLFIDVLKPEGELLRHLGGG
ncbi:TonB family protein [Flavisphingomonas formosensis]|uniref:TonB family protein n=1 Tax=Flavisphingomonas formosensis TaxID=861534 RepID=UPI0012F7AE40|nr:TonB family protein [Sphingomonas formosensis]